MNHSSKKADFAQVEEKPSRKKPTTTTTLLAMRPPIHDYHCPFGRAVVQQNQVMNLTAITEDTAVAKLHLLDSLTVLCCADQIGRAHI